MASKPDAPVPSIPRVFPGVTRLRDALILRERLKGKTLAETAIETGVSDRTVSRVCEKHADAIERVKEQAHALVAAEYPDILKGAMASAKNPENRNQGQCLKVLTENVLQMHARPTVQIGDTNVTIDARSINVDGYQRGEELDLRDILGGA